MKLISHLTLNKCLNLLMAVVFFTFHDLKLCSGLCYPDLWETFYKATERKRVQMTDVCLNMRFRHMKDGRFSHYTFLEGKAVIMVCGGDVCLE